LFGASGARNDECYIQENGDARPAEGEETNGFAAALGGGFGGGAAAKPKCFTAVITTLGWIQPLYVPILPGFRRIASQMVLLKIER
jgi:hypothetical protein